MRIIGEIKHPSYKITVFKHNERVSVKIETSNYEQVYRFPATLVEDTAAVEKMLIEGNLLENSNEIMTKMHQSSLSALQILRNESEEEEFEKII